MDKILEFTSNHPLLVAALMVSFFIVVFTELRRKAGGLVNVEAADAVRLINNDGVVIDIRSNDAYARGHIVNAKNIPSDELGAKLGQLESFKDKPLIAVCDNGITSTRAVNTLRDAGFESVYNLKGGMNGWTQSGLPVVGGKKTRSKSAKQKKKG
ncbi:MAG: rhodanese-like domain-containing protein [Gammaproteobacteria bacterium]|nr:rhodanese-like domain-containing protein [Gammaproteobacteria bacterium]